MKRIIRLTESQLTRVVKRIVNEINEAPVMTPKVPSDLGFQLQDSPMGKVRDWRTGQGMDYAIANTKIIIKPGANIKIVKKGQVQVDGFLYFMKGKTGVAGKDSPLKGQGDESAKAILGKAIPKTIWYDCNTGGFYLWYDSHKIEYGFDSTPLHSDAWDNTTEWFGNKVCGYATQGEMLAQFRS